MIYKVKGKRLAIYILQNITKQLILFKWTVIQLFNISNQQMHLI